MIDLDGDRTSVNKRRDAMGQRQTHFEWFGDFRPSKISQRNVDMRALQMQMQKNDKTRYSATFNPSRRLTSAQNGSCPGEPMRDYHPLFFLQEVYSKARASLPF